jgi:hypothetical protein
MKIFKTILFFMVIYVVLSSVSRGQTVDQLEKLYDQIKNISCDENKVAEVESLVLIREVALFRLNQGRICLFQPVDGRIIGGVFSGEGVFEFSPPTEIERYQLKRFTERENLKEDFKTLYLLFSDSTGMELERRLDFSFGEVSGGFKSEAESSPERFLKESAGNLWTRVLADILADSS